MCRLSLGITICVALVAGPVMADDPPFYLGGRAIDDLPALTDEELASSQQQGLLAALNGDAYGPRAADHEQAGCAMLIRSQAIPTNTRFYGGYQVGGGLPFTGDGPFTNEGTFGWDYFGIAFNKRIALYWSHGRRYQGGTGAYKTDGPRIQRH
jgi:hypothetical protein